MTPARLALHAAVWLGLAVVVAVLATSCGPPRCARVEHDACWYGEEPTEATLAEIARVLPLLPADPWPCVWTVEVGSACPGTHGCYWPDQRLIQSTQAALAHELAHAAGECAGDYDPEHKAAWWKDVR